jgi:hypothetical protein
MSELREGLRVNGDQSGRKIKAEFRAGKRDAYDRMIHK